MPHLLSTEGPRLAVADVNGDGLDDFYVGGAKWQAGKLFIQQRDGTFRESSQSAFAADSLSEDIGATFFDANGDGRQDLLVVSGGNEFWGNQDALLPRLYMNDGHGNFQRARDALPPIFENGSCVAVGDFNGDGYPDLFIGSRVVSRSYGLIPKSHLLENDGTGRFRDVTLEKAPALSEAGMVSSAVWIDYDHDGKLDLDRGGRVDAGARLPSGERQACGSNEGGGTIRIQWVVEQRPSGRFARQRPEGSGAGQSRAEFVSPRVPEGAGEALYQ